MRLGKALAGVAAFACLEGVGCGAGTGMQPDDAASGPTSGRLVTLGAMSHPRSNHTATLLPNGEVLFAGGGSPEVATRSAEIFDPGTGRSRPAADMSVPRLSHTATLLPSGKVLIVGGLGAAARTAELYDPATGSYRPAGALIEPGTDHAAILLESGEVLLVGGDVSGVGSTPTAGAELYDPDADRFVATGGLRLPRRPFGVVRLRDGRVLVAGGTTTGRQVVASAELYDPGRGGFTPTGELLTPRHKHAAALQPDGSVLILGGTTNASDAISLSSAEVYDPASG